MISAQKLIGSCVSKLPGDRNIHPIEPIDKGAWLWHPVAEKDEPAFLSFKINFVSDGSPLTFHVTADMRFQIAIDGEWVGQGPNRSDVAHWSFSSYKIELQKGEHEISAEVWWMGNHAPQALITYRGGFCFVAEGAYDGVLTTGKAPWQCLKRSGWKMGSLKLLNPGYHDIGESQYIDAEQWYGDEKWMQAISIRSAVINNPTGVDLVEGWKCFSSSLPELLFKKQSVGRMVAVVPIGEDFERSLKVMPEDTKSSQWETFAHAHAEGKDILVPKHSSIALLIDLEEYYTAYSEIELQGGKGARLSCEFAESLFKAADGPVVHPTNEKGQRDEFMGKVWNGFGHQYRCDGAERTWRPYWWTSGRYLMLKVQTQDEALSIRNINIREYRYPMEQELVCETSNPLHQSIQPICLRAIQSCSHDSFCDCPYYEQMMYVGDTRLEMLTMRVLNRDTTLTKRGIELFDFSRSSFGFVAERTTSRFKQQSSSFAAIYVLMLRDFALWNPNEEVFVRERMMATRANLDYFQAYINTQGLIQNEPGWTFIDWVRSKHWATGYAPGYHYGRCCVNLNLFYLLALKAQVQLEEYCGSPHRVAYYEGCAEDLQKAIRKHFWDEQRQLVADDLGHEHFSQQANCLAIIADLFDDVQKSAIMEKVKNDKSLAQCTIYFKYYLFEAMYLCRDGEGLHKEYQAWGDLVSMGLKTTVEAPEPTRSDCHAWGAHPMHHLVASIGGLRPSKMGGMDYTVSPCLHDLSFFKAKVPHALGDIVLELQQEGSEIRVIKLEAPKGVNVQTSISKRI